MTEFFIRRPIFAMVLSIVIVILGWLSIRSLPVEQYPDISPPNVQVSAVYQGADAETVDEAVATPLGQSIMGVSDMLYMESTSASDGTMSMTVTFAVGSDPDMNTVFTQNRVATATPMLPASVRQQGVTTLKSSSGFLMVFAIHSDGRFDDNFLSNYAYLNLQNELLKIDGVGNVQILGAGEYSMRIWVKPDVLNYYDISLDEIIAAVEAQSGVYPAGKLGGEPSAPGTEFTYTVIMPPQIDSPEQYADIIIRAMPGGGIVRLGDVARVELGSESYGVTSDFNGQPGAMVAVYQAPGSNAMQVGTAVKERIAELAERFEDGIGYDIVVDATTSIKSGIDDIVETLIIALVLVVLIIFLFIQDLRAMIVPVVAIPVSLVGAFAVFPLLGFTVNIFSLLGLILAIGLVVDDAIIVIEAVQVNMAQGLTPRQATRAAMKAVAPPIIATTVVLAAVFIPVSFIGGITGRLYQQFAITIALSVVISAFNALTLSPALCALVLRNKPEKTKGFFGRFNKWFDRSREKYLGFSQTIIRHAGRTLIFIGVTGLAIWGLSRDIPGGFLPQEDRGFLMIGINLPNASSMPRTKEVLAKIGQIVRREPGVKYISSVAGFSLLSGVSSSSAGVVFVTLEDYKDRSVSATELVNKLNGELYVAVNEAQAFAFETPSIPGLGVTAGVSVVVQDRGGNGIDYLAQHTEEFMERASQLPEIASITSQFDNGVPQRRIVINEEQAMQEGVSVSEIHTLLATYLGGAYINNFNRFGRIYETYIQSEAEYRQTRDDLMNYFVVNSSGESVPLSSFVSLADTTGVEYINQFNLYRSIVLTANTAGSSSSTEAMDALERLAGEVLPEDMDITWSGMSFQERNAAGNGTGAFAIAVIFVFLILAALYESWTLPWSVMLGVPFAVFGAMLFTFLARLFNPTYVNDIFMQISLVLLIGLSAKNAILIVEYANTLFFEQGKSASEAAVGAARLRFRPILMTALAFLLGVLPLVFSSGASSVSQAEMGIALIGGMGIATAVGIFVYPALYAFIAKIGKFDRIRERRRKLDEEDPAPGEPNKATSGSGKESDSPDANTPSSEAGKPQIAHVRVREYIILKKNEKAKE